VKGTATRVSIDQPFERAVLAELAQAERRAGRRDVSHGSPRGGDPRGRETLVESNLSLVAAVATRYQGGGVPFADLVQEGTVGLVRAVQSFDHRRGLSFSAYAVWWIRRSILDAIADSNAIRTPVTASLDQPVEDDTEPLGELMADDRATDPLMSAIAGESYHQVLAMLRLLPQRHREVLTRRFGLADGRAQSHDEIAGRLGVGEERSRQIEREALHRLRSIADARSLAF
jgi:RNA polymerase primary sigma factor